MAGASDNRRSSPAQLRAGSWLQTFRSRESGGGGGGSSPRIRRSLKMRKVIFSVMAVLLVVRWQLESALGLRVMAGEWVGYSSLEARRLAVLEANGRPTRGAALGQGPSPGTLLR